MRDLCIWVPVNPLLEDVTDTDRRWQDAFSGCTFSVEKDDSSSTQAPFSDKGHLGGLTQLKRLGLMDRGTQRLLRAFTLSPALWASLHLSQLSSLHPATRSASRLTFYRLGNPKVNRAQVFQDGTRTRARADTHQMSPP